jgi:hypothetical protein
MSTRIFRNVFGLTAIALLVGATAPANAEGWRTGLDIALAERGRPFFSVDSMLKICAVRDDVNGGVCMGFVSGVFDSLQTNQSFGLMTEEVCAPQGVYSPIGPQRVTHAVVAEMERLVEATSVLRKTPASQLVYFALRNVMSCELADSRQPREQ